jgi:hypothetical protein
VARMMQCKFHQLRLDEQLASNCPKRWPARLRFPSLRTALARTRAWVEINAVRKRRPKKAKQ